MAHFLRINACSNFPNSTLAPDTKDSTGDIVLAARSNTARVTPDVTERIVLPRKSPQAMKKTVTSGPVDSP